MRPRKTTIPFLITPARTTWSAIYQLQPRWTRSWCNTDGLLQNLQGRRRLYTSCLTTRSPSCIDFVLRSHVLQYGQILSCVTHQHPGVGKRACASNKRRLHHVYLEPQYTYSRFSPTPVREKLECLLAGNYNS